MLTKRGEILAILLFLSLFLALVGLAGGSDLGAW